MAKIQLGTGSSSASSHRITQSSHTLNRRYVGKPSNLIIDEAAQSADYDNRQTSSMPSRLVNLRVHAADLEQLQQSEPVQPEQPAMETMQRVVPKVVELGSIDREMPVDNITTNDFSQIVPPEETVEQEFYQAPVSSEVALVPSATVDYSMMQTSTYGNAETQMTEYAASSAMMPVSQYQDSSTMMPAPAEIDTQALAMNIAADYAAASFGASVNDSTPSYDTLSTPDTSIDTIAQAASEAIAAIRVATDPAEVAEQVESLRAFAASIRATSAAPEMIELSDTIEKFVDVAMKSTKVQEEVEKRTAKPAESAKVSIKSTSKLTTTPKVTPHTAAKAPAKPLITKRTAKVAAPKSRPISRRATKVAAPKLVADEDQALRKALRSVAAMDGDTAPSEKYVRRAPVKSKTGRKRFVLAFFCATICVAAVVYFIGTNIPDISVKVAAMQTGIEAKYPSYVPRDFSLSDISSENGKITLTFKGPNNASFVLSEEKSSWDSTALLRNYVEPTWQNNYTTTHEQGITVYIAGSNAAWVNGGVLYKINTPSSNSLTNKQLRNIVTSL